MTNIKIPEEQLIEKESIGRRVEKRKFLRSSELIELIEDMYVSHMKQYKGYCKLERKLSRERREYSQKIDFHNQLILLSNTERFQSEILILKLRARVRELEAA